MSTKSVSLSYDFDQRLSTISASQGGTSVYYASYGYDHASEMTDLVYTPTSTSTTVLAGYHWDYTGNGLVSDEYSHNDSTAGSGADSAFTGTGSNWGKTTYGYDHDSELTSTTYAATFASPPTTNAGEAYDSNGNRTSTTNIVDGSPTATSEASSANRLLYDGTYYYTYDPNGNRTARFLSGDASGTLDDTATDITTYTWNAKNESVAVKTFGCYTEYNNYAEYHEGSPDTEIDYAYDPFGQMVSRTPIVLVGGERGVFHLRRREPRPDPQLRRRGCGA